MVLKFLRNVGLTLIGSVAALMTFGDYAIAAGDRSISNNGISINANHSGAWGRKHGAPIASQFRTDPNDPEMKVSTPSVGGGAANLIKDEATNRCLNANNAVLGSSPNWRSCDANDKDQWFTNVESIPKSYNTGNSLNLGAGSDKALIFESAGNVSTGQRSVREYKEYEFWIVADSQEMKSVELINIGHHVFNAMIERTVRVNGDNSKDYSPWKTRSTAGVWPISGGGGFRDDKPWLTVKGGIIDNSRVEIMAIDDILNSRVNGRFAVRKVSINQNFAMKIEQNFDTTGCSRETYSVAGAGKDCSCATFATRMWYLATGEDFRPFGANLWSRTPQAVFDEINNYNRVRGGDKVGDWLSPKF